MGGGEQGLDALRFTAPAEAVPQNRYVEIRSRLRPADAFAVFAVYLQPAAAGPLRERLEPAEIGGESHVGAQVHPGLELGDGRQTLVGDFFPGEYRHLRGVAAEILVEPVDRARQQDQFPARLQERAQVARPILDKSFLPGPATAEHH